MAECPGGRTNRGTRSQFRLGLPGLGQCKGFYPFHLGDIMDAGQSSQTNISSSREFISPSKATRTLTVREYEQTINELKKENFDLKLKLFLFDEAMKKHCRKDKDTLTPDKDIVQVVVQLNSEAESLRNELSYKEKLLQDSMERAEKFELDFKELEKKYADLQSELSSLSELPSKEEFLSLLEEKENLIKHSESLEQELSEKEEDIHTANQKIEILANQNRILEEKNKKKSIAIEGFVHKYRKEKQVLPEELRNIVISATQAAKNKNKDDLAVAVKSIHSALNQMISAPVLALSESEEKENIGSPQAKCLKGEILEKSSSFLSSQTESPTELSHIQGLKEVLSERNTPGSKQFSCLNSVLNEPCVRGKTLSESAVNIAEKDVVEYVNFYAASPTTEENLISFSSKISNQTCSVIEPNHDLINTETVSASPVSSDIIHLDKSTSKSDTASLLDKSLNDQLLNLLKENEELKHQLEEKLAIIQDLQATCKELELKEVHLQETGTDALKASKLYSVFTQTDIAGCNLIDAYEMARLQKDAKLSSNVEELREDILLLLLAIEDKNKELSDVKQSLSVVQEDLKKALNNTSAFDKDFYMSERNELHERLAFSCSVNEELMRHLKNLEKFMEDLLQNKLDNSLESINDPSGFLSHVSRCLNESLKLSNVLSDHLSICEGSRLFEECESFVYKNGSYSDEKSLPHLDLSELNVNEQRSLSYPGTCILEEYVPFVRKGDQRMRKESDSSQLCWRCWQQLNPPLRKLENSHLMQQNVISKHMGYQTSDSDIWSEPDRNVSMQRIGISLQNSPVASKSPRKLRLKEKRMSSRLSSEQDTSSSELQRASRKRHGSASRRLFSKESIQNQDFTSEKFYFLLAEKYSKLKSLLDELENIKDGKISDEVWIRLNAVVASLGEALQKLHIARENAKNFPSAICGKCVMLELYADLKASHKPADFYIEDSASEQEILQQFSREIHLLKEACKEPFPLFSETVEKRSQSSQSDILIENEQIKINELEDVIVDLNSKNKELSTNLDDVKRLLSKERETLESVKAENLKLSSEIDDLKEELLDMKQKEKELSLKNEELVEEMSHINRNNSELTNILKDLEEKRKESSAALDQLAAELQKNRSDLLNMNEKCLECEKQLSEHIRMKEECENKLKILKSTSAREKNNYLSQIDDLNAEKDHYIQELKNIQERKLALEKENASLNCNLKSKDSELFSLQETIEKLQNAKETLNSNCLKLQVELQNAKEHLANLQKKCSVYEKEVIVKYKENEAEYCRQLKQLEAKSLSEKNKLMGEISVLTNEREDILLKLNDETEHYATLKAEKDELDKNYAENYLKISLLQHLNEELKNKQNNLVQRNEFFENALLSSNSECETLNKDLKCLRDTLQNLESKCLVYEKQLTAAAGMKDSLVECLLNISHEFSFHRQKLNEMCKMYGSEDYVLWDDASSIEYLPVIDEDNVQKLCENISSETKKLSQCIDMLLGLFKSYHMKSIETKSSEEKMILKATGIKKQLEFHKAEADHLKSQNSHFQHVIDELQKSVSKKEKSVQFSAYEIQSLKEKLQSSENEIEKGNQLLKKKDDEITSLQERIFDLQSYINNINAENAALLDKISSMVQQSDSLSPDNQLPSKPGVKANQSCQTTECDDATQNADKTFTSESSLETSRNSCCEKYWKKCYSLQTKLALCKKHIEILEKDKNDLRESLLQQLESQKASPEKRESVNSRLAELESKLEQKKAFIADIKGELLKTCNSLIDKEKEVDSLKQKLAECEAKSKHATIDETKRHSISTPMSVDAHVKTLKNYKWELIQTIFDIQRKFYEKRGIHLNYFDRFKDHVNNLYSLQLIHTLSKSESMPLLGSYALKQQYELGDDRVKHVIGLELDIECLENLKIFLNRFFVPYVLQTPNSVDEKGTSIDEKNISSDRLSLLSEKLRETKLVLTDVLDFSFPEAFTILNHEDTSAEKSPCLEDIASKVSHHLDCIQKFFIAVKQCQWLDSLEISAKDSTDMAEVKSLLQKIFQEIKILHEETDKLFGFNALLKNFDFIIESPVLSTSKPDISDRESVMSEETIAVSRTESPLSFEESCPVKLTHPDTLQLEEKTLQPDSIGNKVTLIEPFGAKVAAIGSSCDSVCQRSHYSSPDLGIESDPNHDSSAPEQKEDSIHKYQRHIQDEQKFLVKSQQKTAFTSTESAGRWSGHKFGDTLYAIGTLPHFELLKQEVKESLIAIKSVLSRTGDGLHHIAKYTSPRKTLEYNTLKSIKDTCVHLEVCLKEAHKLVGNFWTAPCPSEKEWKMLNEENQSLGEQLANLKVIIQKQESEFKKAMGKLEHAQTLKANMEKKISKKLVKTKKVIRQAELKLLETRCQNFPPVPKYPSDQTEGVQKT